MSLTHGPTCPQCRGLKYATNGAEDGEVNPCDYPWRERLHDDARKAIDAIDAAHKAQIVALLRDQERHEWTLHAQIDWLRWLLNDQQRLLDRAEPRSIATIQEGAQ